MHTQTSRAEEARAYASTVVAKAISLTEPALRRDLLFGFLGGAGGAFMELFGPAEAAEAAYILADTLALKAAR